MIFPVKRKACWGVAWRNRDGYEALSWGWKGLGVDWGSLGWDRKELEGAGGINEHEKGRGSIVWALGRSEDFEEGSPGLRGGWQGLEQRRLLGFNEEGA